MTNETNNTTTTNNDDNTTTTRNVRAHNDHFTIASIARDNNIDAKIARRRMRVATRRDDERALRAIARRRARNANDDARVKHEYHNDVFDDVLSIISND